MAQDQLWHTNRVLHAEPLPQASFDAHVDRACRRDRDRAQPAGLPLQVAHSRMRAICHREEWFDTKSLPLHQTQSVPQHALQLLLGEPFRHRLARPPTG